MKFPSLRNMSTRKTLTLLALISPILVTAAVVAFMENRKPPPPVPGDPGVVTLTEFGDFQCPHCASFAIHVKPMLDREFIGNNRIAFQYRHYPVLGTNSHAAAHAAECAREQGSFQEYHDTLYRDLDAGNKPDPESLRDTASRVGLDTSAFQACTQDQSHQARIQDDISLARSLGVRGTPSLFLDAEPLQWRDYRDLRATINQHLSQQTQP